jgi:hypothetical protein
MQWHHAWLRATASSLAKKTKECTTAGLSGSVTAVKRGLWGSGSSTRRARKILRGRPLIVRSHEVRSSGVVVVGSALTMTAAVAAAEV